MKYILTIFGLMLVLTFGVVSLADQSSTADGAVVLPTATTHCNDDGDDDPPSNPEPVDGPDNEDNDEQVPGERDDEPADPEDDDPSYEEDDDAHCIIGGVLQESATPSPSPEACPSPIVYFAGTTNCCPDESNFQGEIYTCICPDSAGGEVIAEYTCSCENGQPLDCLCEVTGLSGTGVPECCQQFGYYCADAVAGDADCDGTVTALDAYETLVVLSGFEASGDCGGSDADCSAGIDPKDTLAILRVVAGVEEASTC
jgi:hypothetical protein